MLRSMPSQRSWVVALTWTQLMMPPGALSAPVDDTRPPDTQEAIQLVERGHYIAMPQAVRVLSLLIVVLSSSICFAALIVLTIYASAFAFVLSSTLLEFGYPLDQDAVACGAATILCLSAYIVVKVVYFLFLIDRVHIVRGAVGSRLKSRLYMFNVTVVIGKAMPKRHRNSRQQSAHFVAREAHLTHEIISRIGKIDRGMCLIGLEPVVMIPEIAFDVAANIHSSPPSLLPKHGPPFSYSRLNPPNNPYGLA
ncbi:uncharacterized protein E0L32_003140 [Thyridium curvatum]|uniref:Uncharacterized protein n=1 Tax=Thyridium curvatum TaxID=1093900 RepID=A0A507BC68_9PEZI|nr:uncharacterized protein E0L32_003140 [Thyridium curvatum]TPX17497.1 hypothetical protein E0L32_003140 [Thyridium curvatum]